MFACGKGAEGCNMADHTTAWIQELLSCSKGLYFRDSLHAFFFSFFASSLRYSNSLMRWLYWSPAGRTLEAPAQRQRRTGCFSVTSVLWVAVTQPTHSLCWSFASLNIQRQVEGTEQKSICCTLNISVGLSPGLREERCYHSEALLRAPESPKEVLGRHSSCLHDVSIYN